MDSLSYLVRIDGHTFGCIVSLIDTNKAVGQFKHVIAKTDDYELGILCTFLHKEWEKGHIRCLL